jgi:hypothetical protein
MSHLVRWIKNNAIVYPFIKESLKSYSKVCATIKDHVLFGRLNQAFQKCQVFTVICHISDSGWKMAYSQCKLSYMGNPRKIFIQAGSE